MGQISAATEATRVGLVGLFGLCFCVLAGAQTAAREPVPTPAVVPSSTDLAPVRVVPPSAAQLPAERADPPRELGKPDDDVRIDIVRYQVDDSAPALLKARLASLTQDFVGKNRGFEDLNNAKVEVTRFLQSELGYYLGYAYVPEQTFQDGVVRIAVLEGRLDKVILKWPSGKDLPVRQDVVQAYLDHLKEGSILLVRDVERVVFLVNDLRGLKARFEVQAGSKPGTANIVVTPEAESVWSGKVDLDVNGSRYLGPIRLAGLAQMNSPLGRGDGLTANALASTTRGLTFGLLGYTTPVGSDGFKLGTSLSAVQYQLDKVAFPLNLNGSALTFTAYGLYPFVRARNLNLFAVVSAEHKSYDDRQSDVGNRKTVDTVALGMTGDFRDALLGGGVNTYDASLVTGSLRLSEGVSNNTPSFSKLGFGFSRLQDLLFLMPSLQDKHSGKVLAYAALRGQLAFANLDTTEQFRLGGPDGVRAFATGEGTGDEGAVLSLEARLLPPESWFPANYRNLAGEVVASVFLDAGFVHYQHKPPTIATVGVAQPNSDVFSGVGVAVSWVRPTDYALRLSLAMPVAGTPRSDTQLRKPRLFLALTKFFN